MTVHSIQTTTPPLLAIMGPTAVGKSRLAIALAERLNGEIISVDSALIYRGMNIGTAKPDLAERRGIPHHLIDIRDPAESYSTGCFIRDADRLIRDISARGKRPILVGGTLLYFNTLFNGMAELPAADPVIRAALDAEAGQRGWAALHQELAAIDPLAAARIHPNDPQRIQRALEVYRLTGVPLTELCAQTRAIPLPVGVERIVVEPNRRSLLHERIRQRFLDMIAAGLIGEVEQLYRRGDLHLTLPALRAVGYRQVWLYLTGAYDRDTLIERGIIATRQFAKRQYTWLRRETTARRYDSESPGLLEEILADIGR
jgi:tRNA dimethylallyltransferase